MLPTDMFSTNGEVHHLDDRALVERALGRLEPENRALVVLHYYLGMPLTDVAVTLGIPVGTVKSRLHRALGEMRIAITADQTTMARPPVQEGQLA